MRPRQLTRYGYQTVSLRRIILTETCKEDINEIDLAVVIGVVLGKIHLLIDQRTCLGHHISGSGSGITSSAVICITV